MDSDYETYEEKTEEIQKNNDSYLEGFGEHLEAQGLSKKTINRHLKEVNFYINTFLLYYDDIEAKQGCYMIDEFLGNWFIRKVMWSNEASIKSNITSIKKFYKYLLDSAVIDKEDYDELCDTITQNKFVWLDLVKRYNDPREENPFSPF